MRKADREIKDRGEIIKLLDECQTLRLALHDEPYPYVVPLSFGWEQTDGRLYVYFHCAKEGKKLELINKNPKVCFETDILTSYKDTGHSVTADYKSVIAFGTAERVYGDEIVKGLELLLKHCGMQGYSAQECASKDITAVVKITVDCITGKRRFRD